MKQVALLFLAIVTIAIAVSILPDLVRDLRQTRKLKKEDALALTGLMLALIPFAMLLSDPSVEFEKAEYTIVEESPDGTGNTAVITVKLKNRQLWPVWVTVQADTNLNIDNPAEEGSDFEPLTQEVKLHLFKSSADVIFRVNADVSDEEDETVRLSLTNPQFTELGFINQAELVIEDNDVPPLIQFSDATYTISEPDSDSINTAVISVTLDHPSGLPISFNYSTEIGSRTASPNSDYIPEIWSLTFAPEETLQKIDIHILADETDEPLEIIRLTLQDAKNAAFVDNTATTAAILNIIDSDELPLLAFAHSGTIIVRESDETAVIKLNLTPASEQVITVDYMALNETAVADESTNVADGTITFRPGDTTQSLSIPLPKQNNRDEPNKQIQLTLQNPQNAVFTTNSPIITQLTIEDDDALPTIQFVDASPLLINEKDGQKEVEIELSSPSAYAPEVTITILQASTVISDDFQIVPDLTLQFEDDEHLSFSIVLTNDLTTEPRETLILALSDPVSATLGSISTKEIHIEDDDGNCKSRPLVDRNNDGELDFRVALLFKEASFDLYAESDLTSTKNGSITQKNVECVLDIDFFADSKQAEWYLIRTKEEGNIGWVQANGFIELLVPAKVDFDPANILTSRTSPGSTKNGPAVCEDDHKSTVCGQDYVLGFQNQQTIDGKLWFKIVLRDSRSGWLKASAFQNLELDYLKEHLPEINVESQ